MDNEIDPWNGKNEGRNNDLDSDPLGNLAPIHRELDGSWSNLLYEDEEEVEASPVQENFLSVSSTNFKKVLNFINERLRIFDISQRKLKLNPKDSNSQEILQCILDLIRLKELDVEKMDNLSSRISRLHCDKENGRKLLRRRKEQLQALMIENNRRKALIKRTEMRAKKRFEEFKKEIKALEILNRKHRQKNALLDKKIFKLESSQQEQKERTLKIVNSDRTDPLTLLKKRKKRKRVRGGGSNRSTFLGTSYGSSQDLNMGPPLSRTFNNSSSRNSFSRNQGRRRNGGNETRTPPAMAEHRNVEVVNTRLWKHGLARNVNNLYRNIVGAYEDQRHELSKENEELKDTLKGFFTELASIRNIIYARKGQQIFHTDIEEISDSIIDMPFEYSCYGIREIGERKFQEIRKLLINEGYNLDHGVGVDSNDGRVQTGTPQSTPSQRLVFGSSQRRRSKAGRTDPSQVVGSDGRTGTRHENRSRVSPSVSPTGEILDDELMIEEQTPSNRQKKKSTRTGTRRKFPEGCSPKVLCRMLNISFSPEKEEELVSASVNERERRAKQVVSKFRREGKLTPEVEVFVRELIDLVQKKVPEEEDRERGMDLIGHLYRRLLYYRDLLYHQNILLGADLKYLSKGFQGLVQSTELVEKRLKYLSQAEKSFEKVQSGLLESLQFEEEDVLNSSGPAEIMDELIKGLQKDDDDDEKYV